MRFLLVLAIILSGGSYCFHPDQGTFFSGAICDVRIENSQTHSCCHDSNDVNVSKNSQGCGCVDVKAPVFEVVKKPQEYAGVDLTLDPIHRFDLHSIRNVLVEICTNAQLEITVISDSPTILRI